MRYRLHVLLLFAITLLLAACAAPRNLPVGPTSIPTLAPVSEPTKIPGSEVTPSFAILSYPAQLPSSARGLPLYQTHCASCHGEDGKGAMPGARNFTDLDYMRGESPASFYEAVTEGRGEMPSFKDVLSSDERWDAVFYMWRFSTSSDTLALGKGIYDANCAACHGEDGVGKVLGAADFSDQQFMHNRAPRDFYLTVTQGKGSMPAWQGRLSQDERWAVIDYLRTFSYDPALPSEASTQPVAQPTTQATATVQTTEAACSSEYLSQTNPFPWDDATAIAAGKIIYDQSCAVCHGADGAGTLPGAPDFTTAEFQNKLHTNSGEGLCIVAEGRGFMPGWKETLSVDQMWQVLTYISSLGK